MTERRLAVVGGGMVAAALLERLVAAESGGPTRPLGDEPRPPYDRIGLSRALAGERQAGDLLLHDDGWYRQNRIRLHTGCRVLALDAERRRLRTAEGEEAFDACVLATGSLPLVPPIPGADLDGGLAFRTLEDVALMVEHAAGGGRAVVIGGGLLGLEAARGLLARGMEVTVVHLMDRLMERQLDHGASGLLQAELERMGMTVLLQASTKRIAGNGHVQAVELADGAELPAGVVVICA